MKLEIGCGTGINRIPEHNVNELTWLQSFGGKDTVAIDCDSDALQQARSNINNGTQFLLMDARKTNFPNNYFSSIHEQGVLHHVINYEDMISESYRILAPGGKIELFETVDNFPLYALARRAVGKWNNCKIESYFKTDSLVKILEKYFTVYDVQYYYQPLWIDIAGYFKNGQLPCWKAIMSYRFFVSRLLNLVGLGKHFCCHVLIVAYK